MASTRLMLFHPDLAASRVNAALAEMAWGMPGVKIVDMYDRYPGGDIDTDREVAELLAADRLVLQFPVQWYSTPPLLKAWQDAVLTRMYYVNPQAEGRWLEGRPLMVAATAGNVREAYAPDGQNGFPLDTLLTPLQATARRCRLPWGAPFLLYGANRMEPDRLERAAADYRRHLRRWIDATIPLQLTAAE